MKAGFSGTLIQQVVIRVIHRIFANFRIRNKGDNMAVEKRLCEECALKGKTCCQSRDIYITPGDVERILEFTGNKDFFEFRTISDPSYLDNNDDPLWMAYVFKPDTTRRLLKWDFFGKCIFLGNTGCTLPLNIRPLVCRLYPYNYTSERFYPEFETGCPTNLLAVGQTLLQSLEMNQNDAMIWHKMLYSEILREKEYAT